MCAYLNLIEDAVNNFVNDNKMFTAFDVTKEVRGQTQDRVYHDEVKKEVHKMFHNNRVSGYARSLASLPNANPQPWLYHPVNVNTSLYQGSPVADNAANAPVAQAAVATPTPTAAISSVVDDGDDDNVYSLDTTNRLCVPNKLVRQTGLKHGDGAAVYFNGVTRQVHVLALNKAAPSMSSHLTSYVVDKDDNIRITESVLNKAGLSGTDYEITGDGDSITVQAH